MKLFFKAGAGAEAEKNSFGAATLPVACCTEVDHESSNSWYLVPYGSCYPTETDRHRRDQQREPVDS